MGNWMVWHLKIGGHWGPESGVCGFWAFGLDVCARSCWSRYNAVINTGAACHHCHNYHHMSSASSLTELPTITTTDHHDRHLSSTRSRGRHTGGKHADRKSCSTIQYTQFVTFAELPLQEAVRTCQDEIRCSVVGQDSDRTRIDNRKINDRIQWQDTSASASCVMPRNRRDVHLLLTPRELAPQLRGPILNKASIGLQATRQNNDGALSLISRL